MAGRLAKEQDGGGGGGGGGGNNSVYLLNEMNQVTKSLAQSALSGQFDVTYGGRNMSVYAVQFNADKLHYSCPAGSVSRGDRCVLCPVGTFFNVVSEMCTSCTHGSYQPEEGQLSCLVCPRNTSTKVVHAKRPEECQGNFFFSFASQ